MNRKIIVILICIYSLIPNIMFSQSVENKTLDSLYIRALNSRFDLLLSSGYKYIEPSIQTERIKANFDKSVYKFLNQTELFNQAYKNGETLKLYRISHKQISADTIDINFGDVAMSISKGIYFKNGLHFRKVNCSLACRGTNGYTPDFRFAYNKEEDNWGIVGGEYKLAE